ncbi:GAF domain-containing protein [uncultured Ruegeria sp.]|uniref:GAF domain-containing protein n=1 Tax=uncultured Ruegeria sp. TaxID=259304 RepID=UPI00260E7C14|nr:GAF domain-containing protein [uncultured Ruegeria sp.]
MTDFTEILSHPNQPEAIFKAVADEVSKTIGAKLFTIMELDREKRVARRSYTNMPDAYPATGEKPMREDAWSAQVEGRHETFVANTIEEIASVFPDHELIQSLGCESCLNLPIVVAGKVIGTLNCLHKAGHYTADRVAAAETLKQPGALALLVANAVRKGA